MSEKELQFDPSPGTTFSHWADCCDEPVTVRTAAARKAARLLLDVGQPAHINGVEYRYKPEEPCLLRRRVHTETALISRSVHASWEKVTSPGMATARVYDHLLGLVVFGTTVHGDYEYKWGVLDD